MFLVIVSKLLFRCEAVLGEFLRDIRKNPESVNFAQMVNVLVLHSQTAGNLRKIFIAIGRMIYKML